MTARLVWAAAMGLSALFYGAALRADPGVRPSVRELPAVVITASAPAPAADGVVNLNEASADEIERLPGIGAGKAKLIVEHRKAHPFKKVEEITKVKGIGKKTFGKLRPYLTLNGPTTLKTEPKK